MGFPLFSSSALYVWASRSDQTHYKNDGSFDTQWFFARKKKQKFFIPHHQITSFQISKGLGDMRSAVLNAYRYETVIEIACQTGTDSFFIRLEVFESIAVVKNYAALKGLICKMNDNGIFQKFAVNQAYPQS